MTLPWTTILMRLAVAVLLAGMVGFDRERNESSAGLRTHALVGMSSCLFMIVSAFGFTDVLGHPAVVLDPSRVAAQVVTGIGFLGAGTILARGSLVLGLTTAASVWSVAAIGMAVGGGLYEAAVFATAFALALLALMRPVERKFDRRWRRSVVRAAFDPRVSTLEQVLTALKEEGLDVARMSLEKGEGGFRHEVEITLNERGEAALPKALQALSGLEGVRSVDSA
ncbi:MAG: MgtC/SapB family protein [Acidobacteria bacterium]|nr:MgtC/SapB family protein [Acidobacteriota bacterium]